MGREVCPPRLRFCESADSPCISRPAKRAFCVARNAGTFPTRTSPAALPGDRSAVHFVSRETCLLRRAVCTRSPAGLLPAEGKRPFWQNGPYIPRTPTEYEVAALSTRGTPLRLKTGCVTARAAARSGYGALHKTLNLRTGRPRNAAPCAQRPLQCARTASPRTSSAQVAILM